MEDSQGSVQVFMDLDDGLDVMVSMDLLGDLEAETVVADAIVTTDNAVLLDAEDLGEIAEEGDKGGAFLGRFDGEGGVVGRNKAFDQVMIGGIDRVDSADP